METKKIYQLEWHKKFSYCAHCIFSIQLTSKNIFFVSYSVTKWTFFLSPSTRSHSQHQRNDNKRKSLPIALFPIPDKSSLVFFFALTRSDVKFTLFRINIQSRVQLHMNLLKSITSLHVWCLLLSSNKKRAGLKWNKYTTLSENRGKRTAKLHNDHNTWLKWNHLHTMGLLSATKSSFEF